MFLKFQIKPQGDWGVCRCNKN